MKHLFFLALMLVLSTSLVFAQNDGRGNRDGNHGGRINHRNFHQRQNVRPNVYRSNHAVVSSQFRSLGVRSYPKPFARGRLLVTNPQRSVIAFPGRGPSGVALHANVFARTNFSTNPLIRAHMAVIMAGSFKAQIGIYNSNERNVGFYYWHRGNGFNYCHYYDRWGYHWYGWYLGNSYFWTRWYSNNWWWYDPAYYRWCYWHDGGWWWQDPDTTTIYIYNNGNYTSVDGGVNVNASASNAQGAPSAVSPVQGQGTKAFFSTDGNREVKVVGNDAFLYDASGQNAFKPIFLGSNVTSVKFSNTNNGKSLQVMLLFSDGSFGLFDSQGNAINGESGSSNNNAQPPTGGNPPPVPGSGT